MATSSAQAGYLAPVAASPYDDPLDDILHDVIVGLTGLPGNMVRPRWSVEPSTRPSIDVSWASFGVVRSQVDSFAYDRHDPSGDGPMHIERDEILFVMHSFYGPVSHALCERFRDGLEVTQNRDELSAAGIGLIEVQEAVVLPALLQEKWARRVDVTVSYRRRTSRAYQVLTIQSADFGLNNELYTTPIEVSNP